MASIGMFVLLVAAEVVPADEAGSSAPRWVALGSDESDAETRVVFGIGALVCGALAAWWWTHGVRRIVGRRPRE